MILSTLATWLDYRRRIARDPLIMSGEACIAGTRIPTDMLYRVLMNPDGGAVWVMREYPHITIVDMQAVTWYEELPHRRFGRWWDEHGWSLVRTGDMDY